MQALRHLPKIDKLIANSAFEGLNIERITTISRAHIDTLRQSILSGEISELNEEALIQDILKTYKEALTPSLKPLINATGVIVHTNLGRSCIHAELLERAKPVITHYSNLEYNLEAGERGERYEHVSRHLCELLGVEDVLVVNNNASAVFLILNTFAKDKEAVVSRGELVEIGGSFRVPDVMSQSGAILKEIGTTNKTRIADYDNAVNENTSILMKVHQSNFSIEGFSEEASFEEIVTLAKEKNLIDYYDLGSGYLPELPFGLTRAEPPLSKLLECKPSLISFSGDKLLGSVQAGIIVGSKALIAKLKKNQLLRMLRVDKITLSLLEESIKAYLNDELHLIPTMHLLRRSQEALRVKAQELQEAIGEKRCSILESVSYVGGGTMPNRKIPTVALHVKGDAKQLEKTFRDNLIIGRIEDDSFLLDLRSIREEDEALLITKTNELLKDK